MPDARPEDRGISPQGVRPGWTGYAITLLLEIALTAGLWFLQPYFPLAKFPIPYVLLIMLAAYWFGYGPAIFAFFVGFIAFTRFFVPPVHELFLPHPSTPEGWARLTAFLLGAMVVALATLLMRGAQTRIQRLAQELERQKATLETFMQNVPVGLGLHDRATRYLIVNPALARINKKPMEEMLGKTVWEVLPPDLAADVASIVDRVFTTGEPSVMHDFAVYLDGLRYFNVDNHPVRTPDGEIIGVSVVVAETTEQVNARKEIERTYEREHQIAEALQSSLTGRVPARLNGFEFETVYRAALEEARVGGDFYDVFPISEDKIGIVIGDVSGKGLKAAVQVALAKYSLRIWAYECDTASCILEQVNKTLARDMDSESFVSIFMGILDSTSRTLIFANAGHTPVLLWSAADRQARVLSTTGPLAGVLTEADYGQETLRINWGDELLLSTDGLFEIRCGMHFLEIEGLLRLYSELKSTGANSALGLVERVLDYCGGELRDDLAVLRVSLAA